MTQVGKNRFKAFMHVVTHGVQALGSVEREHQNMFVALSENGAETSVIGHWELHFFYG